MNRIENDQKTKAAMKTSDMVQTAESAESLDLAGLPIQYSARHVLGPKGQKSKTGMVLEKNKQSKWNQSGLDQIVLSQNDLTKIELHQRDQNQIELDQRNLDQNAPGQNTPGQNQVKQIEGYTDQNLIPKSQTSLLFLIGQAAVLLSSVFIIYRHKAASLQEMLVLAGLFEGLLMVGMQDFKTMYFDKGWLVLWVLMVWLGRVWSPCLWSMQIPGICFSLILLVFVRAHKLGIADVWMMLGMALVFSWIQLQIAVVAAAGLGIVWSLLQKKRMIPFISCLAAACWIILLA